MNLGIWKNSQFKYSRYLKPYYLFFGLILVLRVIFAYSWRVDSDEPQHLHVVYSWANGLLQYRDIFDNHAPLFHLLFAPIYKIFGDRPDIVEIMRLTQIPLFLTSLWAIYLIAKTQYSHHAGLWAVLITAIYPSFFLTSLEFRTDNLWTMFWLLAVAVIVKKQFGVFRIFLLGLLLGAAISTSMKTTLLLSALGLAILISHLLIRTTVKLPTKITLRNSLIFLMGLGIIPAVLILFFAYNNALGSMYYAVIEHNIVPGLAKSRSMSTIVALLLLTFSGIYYFKRAVGDANLRRDRLMLFLVFCFLMLGIYGFWPLITSQDFLPTTPLLIICITGLLYEKFTSEQSISRYKNRLSLVLPVVFIGVELAILVIIEKPWSHEVSHQIHLAAEVLKLTRSGETVMDLKGETIFRTRSYFYVLEGVTRRRIALGLIKDTIPEDTLTKKTYVAAQDSKYFPASGRAFLNQNFLSVGDLRVAGKFISTEIENNKTISFSVAIPTTYILTSEQGEVSGWLDGKFYHAPCQLNPGLHQFKPLSNEAGRLAIIWAPAFERGFSPFKLQPTL